MRGSTVARSVRGSARRRPTVAQRLRLAPFHLTFSVKRACLLIPPVLCFVEDLHSDYQLDGPFCQLRPIGEVESPGALAATPRTTTGRRQEYSITIIMVSLT